MFFKLIDLMGRGADWSLADVQVVRDGMAGANLSLLARSRGWSYSSLEKLVRRIKHGESSTRKQRASRVHADVVDRMEEDIQTNPRQSWADLAVKYERSRHTVRRKLSDRGLPHIQAFARRRSARRSIMRSALPLPRSHTRASGSIEGTTFAIGQDRLLGRKDVQIRREQAQRTEMQSAYKPRTKWR